MADDNPQMRSLLERELGGHFEVTATRGSRSALEVLASAQDIVAVVSDWDMGPGDTGLELLTQVRASWPGIACVLASGSLPEHIHESMREGIVDAFVAKPWQPGDVLSAVRVAIAGKVDRKERDAPNF